MLINMGKAKKTLLWTELSEFELDQGLAYYIIKFGLYWAEY